MSDKADSRYPVIFILSLLGSVLVLLTDFAGWTESTYYGQNDYYVATDSENVDTYVFVILYSLVILHLVSMYIGFQGLQKNKVNIKLGFIINVITLVLTIFSGILFLILASEGLDWWLDTGFYASLIASGVNTYFFKLLPNKIS